MFIKKIFADTFKYGVENKTEIFDSLKYPGLGIFITSLFIKDDSDAFTVQAIILLLVNGYLYIIFATNCHRLFLQKKVPNGIIETLKWNKRNTNFLLTSIALAISLAVCIVPMIFISIVIFKDVALNQLYFYTVTAILMLPIGYVFSRLSLVLPATAIGMDNSWSTSWEISKGYGWSLCFLVTIFPLLTGFVIDAISSSSMVARILTSMLSIVLLFYEISILSNSWKVLSIKAKATQQKAVGGLA